MAGQLIARGEGKWMVRVYVGRDPHTGKRKYHSKLIRGPKKEAQRYLTSVLRERDLGTFVEPTRLAVSEFLDQWLETSAAPRLRAKTLRDYTSLLANHVRPHLGARKLAQLAPVEIQSLYNAMTAKGLSSRTVRYTHAVLHSALEQAVKWRMIARNPAEHADLPRQERREMRALSPADAARFLEAAKGDRWHALWVVLLTAGLRPSEALGLKWSDLDGNRLKVQRVLTLGRAGQWHFDEPKTERSRRTITLPDIAVRALQSHRAKQAQERLAAGSDYEDNGLIFAGQNGAPLDYRNLARRHFKRVLKTAGVPAVRLYDLRHTCATLLLCLGENPKVVSERLGHSTITLTLDTYSHVLPDMQQRAAERLDGLLAPPLEKGVR